MDHSNGVVESRRYGVRPHAPVAQLAEATVSNTVKCRFESDLGHRTIVRVRFVTTLQSGSLHAMDALTGRRTWRTLEPYHAAIYFVADAPSEYAATGLDGQMNGYFASRAAPMGAVSAEVVIATFFNFDHDFVRRSMDGVWHRVTPADVIAARLRAADKMLVEHVMATSDSDRMRRAAELAKAAALVACERPEGRPLFAGHAALEWPDEDHLVLWHAQTLLREFRGDRHIAALVEAGLNGCEALVSHAMTGEVRMPVLKATRQRTDEDWDAAVDSLQERGWLDAQRVPTDVGTQQRAAIEDATDRLALAPYAALGLDRCAELRQLVRPWSAALANLFPR